MVRAELESLKEVPLGGALFSPAQKERERHTHRWRENKRTALSFFLYVCRNNTPAALEGREDILTLERNPHYYFLKIKGKTKERKGGEKLCGCQPISDLRFKSFRECVCFFSPP